MNRLAADIIDVLKKYNITNVNAQTCLESISKNLDRAFLCSDIYSCKSCQLYKSTNIKALGEGPKSPLLILGEGAGQTETDTGRPFIGPAGQLLDKIFADACVNRDKVYLTNTVKCHPPKNRNPYVEEIECCAQYFKRELEFVKPKHILCLGSVAASMFSEKSITNLRGTTIESRGYKVSFTFHPAFILRKKGNEYTKAYNTVVDDISRVVMDLATDGFSDICVEDNIFNN